MAKLNIDGVELTVPDGAPLVEVIKQQGTFISNLCYVDGLAPYAGCRTCLVEIEGARGLQLACTSRATEGMIVRTSTPVVLDARQAVLSIINANHSDRCLTCHRRVHCQPGDICLRDDTVTHRCLTCAKNYRCELQRTNEMLHMENYEPWLGEERTYYESEQPEADRANPFMEFDPQMCIICTRCVRACDEIRHTGAITLAGRGFSTRIAFGAGGAIHESNCDFCGSCIDVCPTATLLEKPNKWVAKTEEWVSTTCNSCSVGCTLSMGVRSGRVVMVKPDRLNPVSWDQVCVRGRFHYEAIRPRDHLTRHFVRESDVVMATTYDVAIERAATKLSDVIKNHGAGSVGFLVGPWATNEEAYLAQKIARQVVGTENVDSTAGPVAAAVEDALSAAFGTEKARGDLAKLATAKTIVVVADDLESSHNVAAVRVKDAVVRNGARLIVVTSRYGEVCDFIAPPPSGSIMPSAQRVHSAEPTGVWLRPAPGGETTTLAVLARLLTGVLSIRAEGANHLQSAPSTVPGIEPEELIRAVKILESVTKSEDELAIVYAPSPVAAARVQETAKAVANLAVVLRGQQSLDSLCVLPTESNVNGVRDVGVKPGAGAQDIAAMLAGGVKALVVVGDNPVMHSPDREATIAALDALDCLVVIDNLKTETAEKAHVLLADTPDYARAGTSTSADRRLLELTRAETPAGDQHDCLEVLGALAKALQSSLSKSAALPVASGVTTEIASSVAGYAKAAAGKLESGESRVEMPAATRSVLQLVNLETPAGEDGSLVLTTGRTLYTSLEGATIRSEEADKLHREEFIELNPMDAAVLGIEQNRPVVVSDGTHELVLSAALTDAVSTGGAFLPLYYDGGIVQTFMSAAGAGLPRITVRPAVS